MQHPGGALKKTTKCNVFYLYPLFQSEQFSTFNSSSLTSYLLKTMFVDGLVTMNCPLCALRLGQGVFTCGSLYSWDRLRFHSDQDKTVTDE